MNNRILRPGESIVLKPFHLSNMERLLTKCLLKIEDNKTGYKELKDLMTDIFKVRFHDKSIITMDDINTKKNSGTVNISIDNISVQITVDTSNDKINECIDKYRDTLTYKTHPMLIIIAPYETNNMDITRLYKENKIYKTSIHNLINYLYPQNPFKELDYGEMNRVISILNDFLSK